MAIKQPSVRCQRLMFKTPYAITSWLFASAGMHGTAAAGDPDEIAWSA